MQNSFINKINVSTRIIMMILIGLSVLVAKSIYLITFLSILCIIFIMLTKKSVKYYIHLLKNIKFLLLFLYIAYIIFFRNIIGSFLFIYKVLLIIFFVVQLSQSINLENLINGVNTITKVFTKKEQKNCAYNVGVTLYLIKYYIESSNYLSKKYYDKKNIYKFSLKKYILPRMFLASEKTKQIENSLKMKFYIPKVENKNLISTAMLVLCVILFIIVVIKEVIM